MHSKTTHITQGEGLAGRVRTLVDQVWSGSVNAAAKDLGVPQSTLQRVVEGVIEAPRTNFTEAFRLGLDVSSDWLIAGVGQGPQGRDHKGRPIVAGVPRWRRAVRALRLDEARGDALAELPYAVWRVAGALAANEPGSEVRQALTASLDAWSLLFESLHELKGEELSLAIVRLRAPLRLLGVPDDALEEIRAPRPAKTIMEQFHRDFDSSTTKKSR